MGRVGRPPEASDGWTIGTAGYFPRGRGAGEGGGVGRGVEKSDWAARLNKFATIV